MRHLRRQVRTVEDEMLNYIDLFFNITFLISRSLQVPDEEELIKARDLLLQNQIDHKLWIEHPENIPTCIALKPYPKVDVQKYLKKYKLLNY